jgi:hypothetical protein
MLRDPLPLRIIPGPPTSIEVAGLEGGITSIEVYHQSLIVNVRLSPAFDHDIRERVSQVVSNMIVIDDNGRPWYDRFSAISGGPDELFGRIIYQRSVGSRKAFIAFGSLTLEVVLP